MSKAAYKKRTSYRFEAYDLDWDITDISRVGDMTYIVVEETEKDGQEDCHQYGELCVESGVWLEACNMCSEEKSAIASYIRDNGLPDEEP